MGMTLNPMSWAACGFSPMIRRTRPALVRKSIHQMSPKRRNATYTRGS